MRGNRAVRFQLELVNACPVCASESREHLFRCVDWLYGVPGEFQLARCNACGLVYLSERPAASSLGLYYPEDLYYAYQRPAPHDLFRQDDLLARAWYLVKRSVLAHTYGYKHLGGNRFISNVMRLPIFRALHRKAVFHLDVLLHPYVTNGALLEVGCGSGMYLDLMRSLGWKRVVGVDVGEKAIESARAVLRLEAYCGELKDINLASESFDAVSLSHTLEHVPDPIGLLREIRRLMKRGGRIAIIVPNVESLSSRMLGEYCLLLEPPRHLVNFTRRSLGLALISAGFRIQRLATTPRGGYQVALFSHSRKAGDAHSAYVDFNHRFPLHRRLRALGIALREHAECIAGLPAGEELVAVAVNER